MKKHLGCYEPLENKLISGVHNAINLTALRYASGSKLWRRLCAVRDRQDIIRILVVLLVCLVSFDVFGMDKGMLDKLVGTEFESVKSDLVAPSQRLHIILLGVESVQESAKFYESLGWDKASTGNEGFVKFDLGGYALCLISREDFAKDANYQSSVGTGFSGVAFICLAKTPEEVPKILAKAVASGGTLVKPATRTNWGVAGYFKDPDGHLFEVDYEDTWIFDDNHRLVVE